MLYSKNTIQYKKTTIKVKTDEIKAVGRLKKNVVYFISIF